jgi:hypothetical protein
MLSMEMQKEFTVYEVGQEFLNILLISHWEDQEVGG